MLRQENDAEHRRQLEELTDAIPSIVAIINPERRFDIVNKRFEEWIGISSEQAIGKHVRDVLGSEGYERVRSAMDRALSGETVQLETYIHYPVAGRKFVGIHYIPRRAASGEVIGLFAHIADLSDRKAAEERLLQSERDLEQIFAQSPAFMCFLTGPDFRFTRVNRRYLELIGHDESILGKIPQEVLPNVEAQGFIQLLNQVYRSGEPFVGAAVPILLSTSTGSKVEYLDFVYQPVRDNAGDVTGIIAQGYVVTDQVKMAQAISRSKIEVDNERENFRNLFKQTPEMVCILRGPDHVFEFVNEAHIRVLGFDATGMAVRVAQPESVEVHGILDEVYRTGKTAELNEIPVTVTNRLRYFNLTYAARRDPNGVIDGVMILGVEITDQVMNRSALQEAIRARDEFMSIASHELKTPLTSLQLHSQLRQKMVMKPGPLNQEKLAQMFESDSRHIRRINRLIDDMLDISRLEAGKLILNRERFDLCEMTQELIQRFGPQLEAADCPVNFDVCQSLFGEWDRFRVEQLVINLLTNAMKYGAGRPIQVRVEQQGSRGLVSVKDQGIGIAPENLDRIFDRFERAISANDVSGLGLGLYIARQIAQLHGGAIRVQSELGRGSTFTVDLPLPTSTP